MPQEINETSDSKTLVLHVIEKYYPHLLVKYHSFFDTSTQMPAYYIDAFYKKTRLLSEQFGLRNSLLCI